MVFWVISLMVMITLILTSHPMAIMVLILIQTLNICLMAWMMLKMSWFSYIMFLIFLGGIMVLFIYITSLASNEKFESSIEYFMLMITAAAVMSCWMYLSSFFLKNTTSSLYNLVNSNMMLFTESMTSPTIIIMTFLLLTLVVAVKIANKFEGPLRNMIKK